MNRDSLLLTVSCALALLLGGLGDRFLLDHQSSSDATALLQQQLPTLVLDDELLQESRLPSDDLIHTVGLQREAKKQRTLLIRLPDGSLRRLQGQLLPLQ